MSAVVARRIADAFATGKIDHVEALLAQNYVDHQGIGAGDLVGPAGFREVVSRARSHYHRLDVEVLSLIESGSFVAMALRWNGLPGDTAPARRETLEVLRFVDEKAVEHWGWRTK